MARLLRLALLGGLVTLSHAHTWIEQMMVIAPNGTFVGQPGFARGNVLRSSPNFGDPLLVNIIPADGRPINQIFASDPMCRQSQSTQTQTDGSPRLKAAPGANVALRYQENGHVSLPDTQPGKPKNRGTVYVYGTTQPRTDDAFLSIHRVWNAQGTGGDGRGVLLSTQNFDDGQCYQVNNGAISTQRQQQFKHSSTALMGADLWCQQDIQLPTTAPTGQPYTLYWVWDWPTLPGTDGFPQGKQEIYTTCMDVDVVNGVETNGRAAGNSFAAGQDFAFAGVATQIADIANPTAVVGEVIPFSAASGTSTPLATNTQMPGFISEHLTTAVATAQTTPVAGNTIRTTPVSSTPVSSTPVSSTPVSSTPVSSTPTTPGNAQQTSVLPIGGQTTPVTSAGRTVPASSTAQGIPTSIAQSIPVSAGQTIPASEGRVTATVSPVGQTPSGQNQQGRPTTTGNWQSWGFNPDDNNDEGRSRGGRGRGRTSDAAAGTATAAVANNANLATVTQVDSVFQTVYQTVYSTQLNRRDVTPTPGPQLSDTTSTSGLRSAACSKTESVYQLRARRPFVIFHNDLSGSASSGSDSNTGC